MTTQEACPPVGIPRRTKEGVIANPLDSAGLSISRDNGKTWCETRLHRRGSEDIHSEASVGIHGPVVELADGRLMAFRRIRTGIVDHVHFKFKMPVSYSGDLGETWQWEAMLWLKNRRRFVLVAFAVLTYLRPLLTSPLAE